VFLFAKRLQISSTGVLNLFKHVAKLINKQKVCGPPTAQILQCDNSSSCTKQK